MQSSIYTNIAFISYKREDEKWARWLQKKLEHYKLPTEIRKKNPNLEFSDHPRHVFKDTTDLSGGFLAKAIKEGLDSSKFLIVICSPRAAKSEWVCKEVQDFIDSGREEYIIPFIIEGEPYAKNPKNECFPTALKNLAGERELLGISINENGRDAAAVKAVARLFDLKFDTLWDRFQREERKRRKLIISLVMGAIFIILGFLLGMIKQNIQIKRSQTNYISYTSIDLIKEGNLMKALQILFECKVMNKYEDGVDAAIRILYDSLSAKGYKPIMVIDKPEMLGATAINNAGTRLLLADQGSTGNIDIWDIQKNEITRKVKGHDSQIIAISYSHDDKYFATGGADSVLKLWNAKTYEIKHVFSGHKNDIRSIHFSPDDKYILTTSDDSTAIIWDISTGTKKQLRHKINCIIDGRFSPSGKYVVTTMYLGSIAIWNVHTGMFIKQLDIKDNNISNQLHNPKSRITHDDEYSYLSSCTFADSDSLLFIPQNNGEVIVYNWIKERLILTEKLHTGAINSINYNAETSEFITTSSESNSLIWKYPFEIVDIIYNKGNLATDAIATKDGDYLIVKNGAKSVTVYTNKTVPALNFICNINEYADIMALHQNYDIMATTSTLTDTVWVFNPVKRQLVIPPIKLEKGNKSVSFIEDNLLISSKSEVILLNLLSQEKKKVYYDMKSPILFSGISDVSNKFFYLTKSGLIYFFDTNIMKPYQRIQLPECLEMTDSCEIHSLWLEDKNRLIFSMYDMATDLDIIIEIHLDKKQEINTIYEGLSFVKFIEYSSYFERISLTSFWGKNISWKINEEDNIKEFNEGMMEIVGSVSSVDGRYNILIERTPPSLNYYSNKTGRKTFSVRIPFDSIIQSVNSNKDHSHFAVDIGKGIIIYYKYAYTEELLKICKTMFPVNDLTPDEFQHYFGY